jgi:hypothetical protein
MKLEEQLVIVGYKVQKKKMNQFKSLMNLPMDHILVSPMDMNDISTYRSESYKCVYTTFEMQKTHQELHIA